MLSGGRSSPDSTLVLIRPKIKTGEEEGVRGKGRQGENVNLFTEKAMNEVGLYPPSTTAGCRVFVGFFFYRSPFV